MILFYYHHVYIINCLLHGEELSINLFISNFKFSVNFFSIDLQKLCFNMYTFGTKIHFLSRKSGAAP